MVGTTEHSPDFSRVSNIIISLPNDSTAVAFIGTKDRWLLPRRCHFKEGRKIPTDLKIGHLD